jgi:pimeloyl-ACP methyl ester carboxylesterase
MLRLLFCSVWVCGSLLGSVSASSTPTSRYERGPSKERVIVFVHGLRGDADGTWTSSNRAYWPQLLLQDSTFDDFDIYVVNYPPHLGGSSTIEDIVSSLYSRLKGDNVTQHRDVTFVCHSLGGIVTERLLLDHPEVAARVSFVYLLGTPLTGSAVANYVSVFGSNPVTHSLNDGQDNDSLQLLENHWKAYDSKIVRYCGYEKKPWAGVGFIVDRQSATRGCDHEVAIDGDHQGIAKPSDRRELSYIGLVNAVRDHSILTDQTSRTEPASSSTADKNNALAQQTPAPVPPPSSKVKAQAATIKPSPLATTQQTINNAPNGIANSGTIIGNPTVINYIPPSQVMSDTSLEIYKKEFPAEVFEGSWLITAGTDPDIPRLARQLCGAATTLSHPWNCLDAGSTGTSIQRPYDVKGNECYLSVGWETDIGRAFQRAWKDAGLTCKYISTAYVAKTFSGGCCVTIPRPVILLGNVEKTLAAPPQGIVGIVGSSDTTIEMGGSSQIAGYETGIQGEDHLHVVMKDQSRIDSNPNPLSPSTDKQSSSNLSGRGLHDITILIPPTDLPLNPAPIGTSSTSSTKDQMDVINALVKEWRDSHPNWTVIGRNAIRWMNQRLEEQSKDFRIKMPEHCNPPLPGTAGVSVPPGSTEKYFDNVAIKNAEVGVIAGQNSKVDMNNTDVVAEGNCD